MEPCRLKAIIGGNIRRQRKLLGKTQKEVGKELGVTHQQIGKYERGRDDLTFAKLVRLTKILSCSWEEICVGTELPEEKWRPSALDLHVLQRLGLAALTTPPPIPVVIDGNPSAVLMEKSLYQRIMGILASLDSAAKLRSIKE